jgi:putative transposase
VTNAYRFIAAEKANYPISLTSRMLGVNRQAFHAWERRMPSQRALEDAFLIERIRKIHRAARGVYGARRIHAELCMAEGVKISRKRVERLMREAGISDLVPRKRGRTTIRVPGVRVADDLVKRDFRPAGPNVLWVADITYLRSWGGLGLPRRGAARLLAADRRLGDGRRRSWSQTPCRWRLPAAS